MENKKINIGIVAAEFNYDVTYAMVELAKEHAKFLNAEVVEVMKLPGTYDIPFGVKILLSKKNIDCIVTLGAVIEGQTDHDEIIAQQASRKIMDLSLEFNKPVALGISGPGMSRLEAHERVDYAKRAVETAVKMCKIKFANEEEKKEEEEVTKEQKIEEPEKKKGDLMGAEEFMNKITEGKREKKKVGRPKKKKTFKVMANKTKKGEEISGPAKLKKIKDEEKKKIIEEIKKKRNITTKDVMNMFNVKRITAWSAMKELIKEGWVKTEGRRNKTRYILA